MKMNIYFRPLPSLLLAGLMILLGSSVLNLRAEDNWARFRGPNGTGHSNAKNIPTKWDSGSIVWKTKLKGVGQSSPVNWGDKLFLTSSSDDGRERYVYCVNAKGGKILWQKTIPCENPEKNHKMNSWATPSCVTDGERVIAFFGPAGLHCFDLGGKEMWSQDMGDFPGNWGVAASPVIFENLVIQNTDCTGPSVLVALDKNTGKQVWKVKREDKPRGGWSTPILIDSGKRAELVLNGEFGVRAYDPKTGKELWFCKSFNGRGAPVPDFANGLVYTVNGKPGDTYAVEPGGSGDVTDSKMKWHAKRPRGRDLPSPSVVGDYLVVVNMLGEVTCYDAKTGETVSSQKLIEKGGHFAAAPLEVNGLLYIQSEDGGETFVIKPGKKIEIVSKNSLGADKKEIFRATLAPIGDRIYARSHTTLYSIGN
ncbi:MAG: PQQ-binding-like beta-propeller repeat protein [Verrucomicrobiota bacterium]